MSAKNISFAQVHIFGLGRAGLSLARSCQQAGLSLGYLWTRSEASAARARKLLQVEVQTGRIEPRARPLADKSLVVLAVRDHVINPLSVDLLRDNYLQAGQILLHLAGALDIEELSAAAEVGVQRGVFHPLRSLDAERSLWAGAVCGISGDPDVLPVLQSLAQSLGCRAQVVRTGQRGLYHAAASIAANDLLALFALAEQALQQSGLDAGAAQAAVVDLMSSALGAARDKGWRAALTGPVARGDDNTLSKHYQALRALSDDASALHELASRLLAASIASDGPDLHLKGSSDPVDDA